jgi:methylthioribose-1-phosphate isomerase
MTPGIAPVWWDDDAVGYIDQRRLPRDLIRARAATIDEVVAAIGTLAVRGAPAIGVFAGYGVALARRLHTHDEAFRSAVARIRAARPTAVNLAWAVDRIVAAGAGAELAAAQALHDEQRAVDRAIAEHGAALMPVGGAVITHCNTGPLATGGGGTALGVIVEAWRRGKRPHVVVDETRPLLQGARLTTVELAAAGVAATLIADGAAATAISHFGVACAIVGADRIARNGDTANKIGTLGLALAAAYHRIPFYVAAPRSTVDFAARSGADIPIEERDPGEVRTLGGVPTAPEDTPVYNPAFDVTPGRLVAGIVTEFGVCRPPYEESIADLELRPGGLFAELSKR